MLKKWPTLTTISPTVAGVQSPRTSAPPRTHFHFHRILLVLSGPRRENSLNVSWRYAARVVQELIFLPWLARGFEKLDPPPIIFAGVRCVAVAVGTRTRSPDWPMDGAGGKARRGEIEIAKKKGTARNSWKKKHKALADQLISIPLLSYGRVVKGKRRALLILELFLWTQTHLSVTTLSLITSFFMMVRYLHKRTSNLCPKLLGRWPRRVSVCVVVLYIIFFMKVGLIADRVWWWCNVGYPENGTHTIFSTQNINRYTHTHTHYRSITGVENAGNVVGEFPFRN